MRAVVVGNVTRDPELKFVNSGKAVCSFTVADSYRPRKDAEEQVVFVDCVLWEKLGENFANSVKKGQRVFVEGRMQQRNWETDEGQKRSKMELVGEFAGPDLRWQTAEVHHVVAPKADGFVPKGGFSDDPF